jgi:hypothetical protein
MRWSPCFRSSTAAATRSADVCVPLAASAAPLPPVSETASTGSASFTAPFARLTAPDLSEPTPSTMLTTSAVLSTRSVAADPNFSQFSSPPWKMALPPYSSVSLPACTVSLPSWIMPRRNYNIKAI